MKTNFYTKLTVTPSEFTVILKDSDKNIVVLPIKSTFDLERELIQLEASDIEDKTTIMYDTYSILTADIISKKIKTIYVPNHVWSERIGKRATAQSLKVVDLTEGIDLDDLTVTSIALNNLSEAIKAGKKSEIAMLSEFVSEKMKKIQTSAKAGLWRK